MKEKVIIINIIYKVHSNKIYYLFLILIIYDCELYKSF